MGQEFVPTKMTALTTSHNAVHQAIVTKETAMGLGRVIYLKQELVLVQPVPIAVMRI
jgi:hypothetical protein